MPEMALREIIEIAHEPDVPVSTDGFIEHVLTLGPDAVERYIDEVAHVGFDILQVPAGCISILTDDMLITEEVATWHTDVVAAIALWGRVVTYGGASENGVRS